MGHLIDIGTNLATASHSCEAKPLVYIKLSLREILFYMRSEEKYQPLDYSSLNGRDFKK